jgi:periplasmic divalent cation tolerance protein
MEKASYIVILITTDTDTEASKIAEVLLANKKVACVNIVPRIDSHFWWRGALDSAQEHLLIVKTKASLLDEIIDLVKQNHSYDVPEVIALPIISGNPDYLKWIDEEVAD